MSSAPASTPYTGTGSQPPQWTGSAYDPPPQIGRGPGRRIGVALGILFSVGLIAWGVLWIGTLLIRQEETTTTTVAEPFSRVVIETSSGDVDVQAGDSSGAMVRQRLRWSFNKPTVITEVHDGVLPVHADCTSSFQPGPGCSVNLVVHIPAGTPTSVDTGSGDVAITGLAADVELKTGSGDIAVRDHTGSLQTRTGSGDVTIIGVTGGAITANTGSGDIEASLDVAPDQVTLRTGSGDVDLRLPQDDATYDVEVDTGAGDKRVDVRTDPDSPRSISARTGSGDVTIAYS